MYYGFHRSFVIPDNRRYRDIPSQLLSCATAIWLDIQGVLVEIVNNLEGGNMDYSE